MTEEPAHPIVRSSTPVRAFNNIGDVAAVAVFPDRRRMATNSSDGMLRLWDLKNGVMLKEIDGHGAAMAEIALSRDGQLIASSDCAGYVIVWHGETGKPVTQAFKAHTSSCSLAFSPDGATLATGSSDSTIKLWSTETWQLQGEPINLGDSRRSVNCVRYSPSGEHLAIATQAKGIQIWDPVKKHIIANVGQGAVSLVWMSDGTRLLSGNDHSIQQWDSSTWEKVGDIWKSNTKYSWRFAMNCNGTVVASPTTDNHIRLWRLSDWQTIAIFQRSDSPYCVTFSMDGKYILAGGKDKKILEWAVPEHAWPENTLKDQATRQGQDFDTKAKGSYTEIQDSETKIIAMNTTVRNACVNGDLSTAEELLMQEIANGENYRSYADRSIVMARKLDWDHALDDATKSISIQPSFIGYVSKGIALCGKKQVRDAKRAFDLASIFTDGDSKTCHFLFLIKSIALFRANQHAEAIRRVRELAAACPDADTTLASRTIEVYLLIQLGNNAMDRACPTEATGHFTAAVNAGTFLSKSPVDSKYEEFVVLFGCDLNSLWQTANQKRCHALLGAGRLAEVFEAFRYMADMSDEATRASCLHWSIGFMQELSTVRDHAPNADATPNMCKYDDENDSISDIDSDIDHVDDVV